MNGNTHVGVLHLAWNLYARAFDLIVNSGNLELGAKLLSIAHELVQLSGGYDNITGAELYNGDGVLSLLRSDAVSAEQSFRKALELSLTIVGPETTHSASYGSNLAQALAAQKKFEEAEQQFKLAIATLESIKAKACEHTDLTHVNVILADATKEYAAMAAIFKEQ